MYNTSSEDIQGYYNNQGCYGCKNRTAKGFINAFVDNNIKWFLMLFFKVFSDHLINMEFIFNMVFYD